MVSFQRAVLSLSKSSNMQRTLGILCCPSFLFLSEILKCSSVFLLSACTSLRRIFSLTSFPVDSCK